MDSINLLNELNKIPVEDTYTKKTYKEILSLLDSKNTQDCFIEAAMTAEISLLELFNARNIPDRLFKAYEASFTRSDISLYQHYIEMIEKGENSTNGFINNLKGKFFEFELPDKLSEVYPDYSFDISTNPIQPIWDIRAISDSGSDELLIQAKLWAEGSCGKLTQIMDSNENILYATSTEIREKILENTPELAEQFIPIDISSYEFTESVKENLETLRENLGIDVPDELGDLLPYISEIILGLRLLMDLISVQKDFKTISAENKVKLSGVKVIMLLSRYGITTTCGVICSLVGTSIGGALGTAGGAITGGVLSWKLNKELKPYLMPLALKLVDLSDEDMFYFNNKNIVDELALSYKKMNI